MYTRSATNTNGSWRSKTSRRSIALAEVFELCFTSNTTVALYPTRHNPFYPGRAFQCSYGSRSHADYAYAIVDRCQLGAKRTRARAREKDDAPPSPLVPRWTVTNAIGNAHSLAKPITTIGGRQVASFVYEQVQLALLHSQLQLQLLCSLSNWKPNLSGGPANIGRSRPG